MEKVLVISGHPNLQTSWTNKVILKELQQRIENLKIHCLDELYPDYRMDVEAEQQALLEADLIVLQFPFYWYSVPALLKKWIDDVLTFNFAFGPNGDKLKNKKLILSFTVGGPEESYDPLGYNHFTIEQMIRPLQQTVYLTGMEYCPPVFTHRMVYIPDVYNTLDDVEARAMNHADRLVKQIEDQIESIESKLKTFVKKWFQKFDTLPNDNQFFKNFISDEIFLDENGEIFHGFNGFDDWYSQLLAQFSPDVKHEIEQVKISDLETGEYFELKLRVRVRATLKSGEEVNQLVNETWLIRYQSQKFLIEKYVIKSVFDASI